MSIVRRPQNLKKIHTSFLKLLNNVKTKREIFFKFLWHSQNIWTLKILISIVGHPLPLTVGTKLANIFFWTQFYWKSLLYSGNRPHFVLFHPCSKTVVWICRNMFRGRSLTTLTRRVSIGNVTKIKIFYHNNKEIPLPITVCWGRFK